MRRLALVTVSVLVGVGGALVLPSTAVGASSEGGSVNGASVSITRYGGADRYVTSLRVAEAFAADAGGSVDAVVLVSGERWTDAVVAAPVAGALDAPVLMTPPLVLRAGALGFLQRVGVSSAVVVGPQEGGGAHGSGRGVGAAVLTELSEAGIRVERVAGADRFATSIEAAREVTPGVMPGVGRTAIVASGEVFADALVAGPIAARGIHPVLLSRPDALPADAASYLGTGEITHVVLMGGTAALSESVEQSITDLGVEVTRVAGASRYDTAVKAAELVEDRYSDAAGKPCFANDTIGIARARVPFDSFSAAPLLARLCAPLVLADPAQIPADTGAYLDTAREAHATVDLRVFGGDAAVSQAAINAYLAGEDASEREAGADGSDDAEPVMLAAGMCGGSAADPPSRLVNDPTSQDPAWSPDCARIVYSRGGSLWTARRDGADARIFLPDDGALLEDPAWSPDGTKIAFVRRSYDAGRWAGHIWVADVGTADRAQLTRGDVEDKSPTWSPDGTRIAFERLASEGRDGDGRRVDVDQFLAVINADGGGLTRLTEGRSGVQDPAWSPDGEFIAYIDSYSVRVVTADGSSDRVAADSALWRGGVSWSPDGTKLAFAVGDIISGSDIVTIEVNGFAEHRITDLDGWAVAPRWSPDGQLIAFTHYEQTGYHIDFNAARYAAVVGSAGTRVLTVADMCKPRGLHATTAGFPLPGSMPTKGTVRVAVLFVDFPDAQADHSTHQEAEQGLPWAEEYVEKSSYRKLDLEYVPHHEWLRAPHSYRHYLDESVIGFQGIAVGGENKDAFYQDVLRLIDDDFDFSGVHSLAVVLPSSYFGGGVAGGFVEADGTELPAHVVGVSPMRMRGELRDWGGTTAHELMHNLGLLDMYPYDRSVHEQPDPPADKEWVIAAFGRMGLRAFFLAAHNDDRLRIRWRSPDGRNVTNYRYGARASEMLAWSRWQLDWLHERQVHCVADETATVKLAPIARTGGAIAMAAVPISRHEMIVIESRRDIGYDRDLVYTTSSGVATEFLSLVEEGVLVYTVDTLIGSGQLPLRVAGDSGNGQVDDYPVLQAGESVTVAGWTITVTADDGDTHTVRIARKD